MPEGDIVWYTARQLDDALAGRVLVRSDFRVPRYATADLTGQQVTQVLSRGKHLLIRTSGGLTVHTHLKMDGYWRIGPAGAPLRDAHKVRLILGNDQAQAAGYSLGITQLLPTSAEDTVTGHLGPDLLGPGWDAGEAVRRLLAQPGRAIAEALLDQGCLCGIGNLYKCEVLFLRGVGPWRRVDEAGDLAAMVELARALLEANKQRIGQVTTGQASRGQQTWVYGRRGAPCRRCGTPVRKHAGTAAPDRITFWCPSCQPGPPPPGLSRYPARG